ncbi:haloacid dehalogenase-like hydrolase [Streptococcus sp. NLN76]|uniref:haloacid dehalogenase-like hydrolase n=1 Tax=Streptococcus sp. NLN76 TaxID=2822800 RepID=UPI0018ABBA96|nr:haloacid dehalogenase-like hydrolase [Streptococcus sp. NLN76]MBF8969687.1 haloacid dehalogenase-like hydrolase [Streptococcus sp. NLN76]
MNWKTAAVLVCGTSLLLGACQANMTKEESKSDKLEQSSTSQKSPEILMSGNWESKAHARLTQLIQEYGKSSPNYSEEARPYAVFDWDNTTIINDIGEATFVYQIENLAFKVTPEEFGNVIRTQVPEDVFSEDYHNEDDQAISIKEISADLEADYQYLYREFKGFEGTKSLEEIQKTDQYKDFRAKLLFLYEAIGDTFSSDISYPWVTYLYAGMTSEEVQKLSEESIAKSLKDELVSETWESPGSQKGQAGQVEIEFKRGIRKVKEVQDLYQTLMKNGIDVYVNSASYYDVILPFATSKEYGYGVPEENVFAMRLSKSEEGVIMPELDSAFTQTQGSGKTETINQFMAPKQGDSQPILIAGDSNGDYAMLSDFPELKMGLIFNLLRNPEKGIGLLAKEAVADYDQEQPLYYLQGRDENKGVLISSQQTIPLGEQEAVLVKD